MDNLMDLASILRSKNAGPLNITFDIIFKDQETFCKVKNSGVINKKLISQLYKVDEEDVLILEYEVVKAIKITIRYLRLPTTRTFTYYKNSLRRKYV